MRNPRLDTVAGEIVCADVPERNGDSEPSVVIRSFPPPELAVTVRLKPGKVRQLLQRELRAIEQVTKENMTTTLDNRQPRRRR